MKSRYAHIFIAAAAMLTLALAVTASPVALAVNPGREITNGVNAAGGGGTNATTLPSKLATVVNVLLFIIGAIAVIMIVVGGLRYVLSGGDASQTKSAKDTILYSVVGLIVAILAYAIVNFVVGSFK